MTFRELREARKLTQHELARLCDLRQATISQIENGRIREPRYRTIKALSDVLDVSPELVARAIRATEAA